MELNDIFSIEQIFPDLQADDRWQIIDELVNNLVATGKIKPEHREAITAVVRRRETSMSTGIGLGIAVPEGAIDLVLDPVFTLGRSRKGIAYNGIDNEPVHLVLLSLFPPVAKMSPQELKKFQHTFAAIAKMFHESEFRQSFEQAPDAESIFQLIRENWGQ